MKVVFMGTPEFAVPCLERLIADGHEVLLVVTRADKPKGRGQVMTPPPVKECALSHNIAVYQPTGLRNEEAYERLLAEKPDIIIVVAYGRILPENILALPKYGCVNIHASLLPKYRGAAPIQWAVLNGETEAGVTSMQMDAGLDTGDMLLTGRVEITPNMTGGELHDALSLLGAQVLSDTMKAVENGTLQPQKQDDSLSNYAPMLDKTLCPLDFKKSAAALHNQVRGLNPWPVATCNCNGKMWKVYVTEVGDDTTAAAGTVVKLNPLSVACGDGKLLIIKEIKTEGSRKMTAEEYLRGHAVAVGTVLE